MESKIQNLLQFSKKSWKKLNKKQRARLKRIKVVRTLFFNGIGLNKEIVTSLKYDYIGKISIG